MDKELKEMLTWINENLKAVIKNQNYLCLQIMALEKKLLIGLYKCFYFSYIDHFCNTPFVQKIESHFMRNNLIDFPHCARYNSTVINLFTQIGKTKSGL